MRHTCVKCGQPFIDARPLIPPVFCASCLEDIWTTSSQRGRRLAWYDSTEVSGETPSDQHLRAIGAPSLPGFES